MSLPNVWVRIIVGMTLIPVILLLAWAGGLYLLLFVDLVIILGLREFYRIALTKEIEPNQVLGMLGGIGISLAAWGQQDQFIPGIITVVLIVTASVEIFRKNIGSTFLNSSVTVFGMLYVGWLITHLILLRQLPARYGDLTELDGVGAMLMALLIPWVCDTAAYFSGRAFGKHKLIPMVSAGKTVEGAFGGLVCTPLVLLALRTTLFPFLSVTDCVCLGLFGAILSQTGDLVESLIKRDAGVKDASQIIPGHGGVLDRFDSVLFSAPFTYYYLILVVL